MSMPAELPEFVRRSLNRNAIGDDGASAIAKAIVLNRPHLVSLEMNNNLITDRGILVFAPVVSQNQLTQLDLSRNMIGDNVLKDWADRKELHKRGRELADKLAALPVQTRECANDVYERANKLFSSGAYDKAIEQWSRLIDPSNVLPYPMNQVLEGRALNNVSSLIRRAGAFLKLDRPSSAECDCSNALTIAMPRALFLARSMVAEDWGSGYGEEARRRELVDLEWVGTALQQRGQAREALGEQANAFDDYLAAKLLVGEAHFETKEYLNHSLCGRLAMAAAEQLDRLPETQPTLPTNAVVTSALNSVREYRELILESDAEHHTTPGQTVAQVAALLDRAVACLRAQQYDTAVSDWGAVVSCISDLGTRFIQDKSYALPSDEERARVLADWGANSALLPPPLALSMLGTLLRLSGDGSSAKLCFDRAVELQPNAAYALLQRSLLFELDRRTYSFVDADLDVHSVLAEDEQNPDAYVLRAQLHVRLQSNADAPDASAIADLRHAITLEGCSMTAWLLLGEILPAAGDAEAVYLEAAKRFPTSAEALTHVGAFMWKLAFSHNSSDTAMPKLLNMARDFFSQAIDCSGGKYALAHINYGMCHALGGALACGNPSEAASHCFDRIGMGDAISQCATVSAARHTPTSCILDAHLP